jgi:hypothetical protein
LKQQGAHDGYCLVDCGGEAANDKLARDGGAVQCGTIVLMGGVAQSMLLAKLTSSLLSSVLPSSIINPICDFHC